jgi:hypothetical protein
MKKNNIAKLAAYALYNFTVFLLGNSERSLAKFQMWGVRTDIEKFAHMHCFPCV